MKLWKSRCREAHKLKKKVNAYVGKNNGNSEIENKLSRKNVFFWIRKFTHTK